MIVKNEGDRILRALEAAKPVISTFAILDTGSTDATVEIIREWAAENGLDGIVGVGQFVDFSQARNQALDLARSWRLDHKFDFLLLQDADMELVITDLNDLAGLKGEMYELNQTGGAVTYSNARLLAAWSSARYVGRTHEYLAVAPAGLITGLHFIDHADGANRADKYERDVALLVRDLDENPKNERAWFYLGNTYRELGNFSDAEEAYRNRITLGGWDEETYVAMCNVANCRKERKDEAGFVEWNLKAHQFRPCRAEPLYDLAKHFREKGDNHTAMIFIERGMAIPRPDDRLFVNDWVYSHGFREELSIAGWYSEADRERAGRVCNELALDKSDVRHLARANMVHYLRPLVEHAPSTRHYPIDFQPPPGYVAMNPSVAVSPGGRIECIVRTVNYRINEHGQYMIGEKGCQDAPIDTLNFLVSIDRGLETVGASPIIWERGAAKFPLVIGLEDMRLFWHQGVRKFVAAVREQSEWGRPEQWEGQLEFNAGVPPFTAAVNVRRISDPDAECEKNWGPIMIGPDLRYVYRLDKMRTLKGEIEKTERPFACENISGSSQWIDFLGGYLAVVHEAIAHNGKRIYQHRFAWTNSTFSRMELSLPFVFHHTEIEFCAGLALDPTGRRLIISYGVRDEQAWLATISHADVVAMLGLT